MQDIQREIERLTKRRDELLAKKQSLNTRIQLLQEKYNKGMEIPERTPEVEDVISRHFDKVGKILDGLEREEQNTHEAIVDIEEHIAELQEEQANQQQHVQGNGLSPYKIQPYTYQKAKKLGVQVFPSKDPKKKISVYDKNGKHICDIGAKGYGDFPTFKSEKGLEYALQRRALYKKRHEKDRHIKGSNGWWADQLLW